MAGPRALTLTLALVTACSEPVDRIGIRGSDSEVNLVQRLAESFMARYPKAYVSVTGGGSGVGIAALIDGTCELATSSRPLHPEEKLLALRSGIRPHPHIFAQDALTVIVNDKNPIKIVELATVGALFRGEIKSWTALGGIDARVVPYGRQSSSGTYAWFRDHVVRGEYTPEARQMNGTAQIVEAVARDPGGIGYVAAGYLKAGGQGIHALSIGSGAKTVSPLDDAAVASGRYPIVRPLFQFSNGLPEGLLADFLQFEQSSEAEEIIREMGFFPAESSTEK